MEREYCRLAKVSGGFVPHERKPRFKGGKMAMMVGLGLKHLYFILTTAMRRSLLIFHFALMLVLFVVKGYRYICCLVDLPCFKQCSLFAENKHEVF